VSDRDAAGSGRLPSLVRTVALHPHPALARWRGGLLCRLEPAEVGFWHLTGTRAEPLGRIPLIPGEEGAARAAIARLLADRHRARLVLRLPPRTGLLRFDLLPAEVLEQMDEVLPRRLAELVPWPPRGLRVRWWPTRRLADGRVEVALAVVPEARLQAALDRARALGIEPSVVDFELDDPLAPPRFDLLATDPPVRRLHRRMPALALAVLLLVDLALLGVLRWQDVERVRLERTVAELRERVAQLADRTAESRALEERLARVRTWAERNGGRLALLERLSRMLPDDVWLERLVVEGRTVRLHGYAPDSAALVRLFERAREFADTRFLAPALRVRAGDDAKPLERFVLETRLVGEGP